MRTAEAFRMALEALRANRLRSALTMLGVIIGVSAVVVLVAVGTGAKNAVESEIAGLGSNIILVVPGRLGVGALPTQSRLDLADVAYVRRVVGDPSKVTVSVNSGETVRVGRREAFVTVVGTDENLPNIFDRPLRRGRHLGETDVDTRRRVAVLGSEVAQTLFGDVDPVGRQLTVSGARFRVVGVYETVGATFGVARDQEIHVPVTTAQRLLGVTRINGIAVGASGPDQIEPLQRRVVDALTERYPGSVSPPSPRPSCSARSAPCSACSPGCSPPSRASRCSSAGSGSPTSCWSASGSGPGRSACARPWAPGNVTCWRSS
nr:hypothetical protein GCM10020093_081690 [Planobispora longispora]